MASSSVKYSRNVTGTPAALSSWKKLTNICCPLSMSPIGINGGRIVP